MKRTSQFILYVALLAAVGFFTQSVSADGKPGKSRAQPKKQKAGAASKVKSGADCGDACCGGPIRCAIRRAVGGARSAAQSGQPFIDPGARADWMAAQQAANMSWHAGYYHTATGAPVALMVSPHARMHTRWSWGVAQSSMYPLYHQFERPYPGPVSGGAAAGIEPLRPTPRWPSHTDQFGVYYVRGPW
ncbi:MAG: hypothetical protein H8E44_17905 [Planctomycetes bacterium]|nr:hypothetical protein [Planctomycetota bacterium]MBL7040451.1 hypothetical protein [Pirellulaceae bacterium]